MTRSESLSNLATALAKAQAEMPVAAFDATNPFLKSKYATLGAVIQASRPILAKHRLSLVQFPISSAAAGEWISPQHPSSALRAPSPVPTGEGCRGGDYIGIESILTHESGEFIAERILIPLAEEKGKSKVQSAGSTLTYLRRYSWASILGMYSDEDLDGVAANLPAGCVPHRPSGKMPDPTPSRMPGTTAGKMPAATALPPPPPVPMQKLKG
jgi:hypothetical protein